MVYSAKIFKNSPILTFSPIVHGFVLKMRQKFTSNFFALSERPHFKFQEKYKFIEIELSKLIQRKLNSISQ